MSALQEILDKMYIDPELLAQLNDEQKQILFMKMRDEQVRKWRLFEERIASTEQQQADEQESRRKRTESKVKWLLGADGNVWVWVMGEDEDCEQQEEHTRPPVAGDNCGGISTLLGPVIRPRRAATTPTRNGTTGGNGPTEDWRCRLRTPPPLPTTATTGLVDVQPSKHRTDDDKNDIYYDNIGLQKQQPQPHNGQQHWIRRTRRPNSPSPPSLPFPPSSNNCNNNNIDKNRNSNNNNTNSVNSSNGNAPGSAVLLVIPPGSQPPPPPLPAKPRHLSSSSPSSSSNSSPSKVAADCTPSEENTNTSPNNKNNNVSSLSSNASSWGRRNPYAQQQKQQSDTNNNHSNHSANAVFVQQHQQNQQVQQQPPGVIPSPPPRPPALLRKQSPPTAVATTTTTTPMIKPSSTTRNYNNNTDRTAGDNDGHDQVWRPRTPAPHSRGGGTAGGWSPPSLQTNNRAQPPRWQPSPTLSALSSSSSSASTNSNSATSSPAPPPILGGTPIRPARRAIGLDGAGHHVGVVGVGLPAPIMETRELGEQGGETERGEEPLNEGVGDEERTATTFRKIAQLARELHRTAIRTSSSTGSEATTAAADDFSECGDGGHTPATGDSSPFTSSPQKQSTNTDNKWGQKHQQRFSNGIEDGNWDDGRSHINNINPIHNNNSRNRNTDSNDAGANICPSDTPAATRSVEATATKARTMPRAVGACSGTNNLLVPRPAKPPSRAALVAWFQQNELPLFRRLYGSSSSTSTTTTLNNNINTCADGIDHLSEVDRRQLISQSPVQNQQQPCFGVQPPIWFHGILSRQDVEQLLSGCPAGTFLVRVSERIFGYTVSCCCYCSPPSTEPMLSVFPPVDTQSTTAVDSGPNSIVVKHFLVEHVVQKNHQQQQQQPKNGQTDVGNSGYRFIGINQLVHPSLEDLVEYHHRRPITKRGGERLIHPVGQPKQQQQQQQKIQRKPLNQQPVTNSAAQISILTNRWPPRWDSTIAPTPQSILQHSAPHHLNRHQNAQQQYRNDGGADADENGGWSGDGRATANVVWQQHQRLEASPAPVQQQSHALATLCPGQASSDYAELFYVVGAATAFVASSSPIGSSHFM